MAILGLGLGLGVLAAVAHAQFVSSVNLVEVYASVVDGRGNPVRGLTADAFVIDEDGERQEVQTFAAGDFPLALAIGIDRSFSMTADRLVLTINAVRRFLGDLRADDEVMVLAIGSEVETLAPLSTNRRAAYDALAGLQRWGTTPLFDAVLRAIDAVQHGRGRRALILITDGDERYSEATAAQVVSYARGKDVLLYPIALNRRAPVAFAELAAVTGGRAFAVDEPRVLPRTLSLVAEELRSQYLLGYIPRTSAVSRSGWRSISVRTTRPDLRVRAREGYDPR